MRITIPAYVKVTEDNSENVLFNLENGNFYGLDQVGSHFLQLIEEKEDFDQVIASMKAEYDVSEVRLRNDFENLLVRLKNEGLVTIHE